MPRPTKCRRVCAMPRIERFGPQDDACAEGGPILFTVDEYEAIRLIDLEHMTQEQCAAQMEVARTTVQAVYESARSKLADALVNGRQLVIGGGSYRVCPHGPGCRRAQCPPRRCAQAAAGSEKQEKEEYQP